MNDNRIIELYFARDESAIDETDKKYGRYCHYIAFNILHDGSDAAEIVNDTYLKTWNSVPPNRPNPLKGYVGKISNRLAVNRYYENTAEKRGGSAVPLVLDELSECVSGVEAEFTEGVALRDSLNRFLSALPKKTRDVFVRRYWYASPVAEIAKEFGLKESHVTVLMLRTRKKLKDFLEKEGYSL